MFSEVCPDCKIGFCVGDSSSHSFFFSMTAFFSQGEKLNPLTILEEETEFKGPT